MRIITILICIATLAGCARHLPSADSTISNAALDAPFPTLEHLPTLLAQADAGSTIEVEAEALAARVARLKARANALRGRSVVDGQTRLKLASAVAERGY